MIYFYKHKKLNELNQEEINMLGFDGIKKFSEEHHLDPNNVFSQIHSLEEQISNTSINPLDLNDPAIKKDFDNAIQSYIEYFNNCATYQKQAYVIIGNIGSGKSTYASQIEDKTHSIIIDSDKFKSGEQTKHGYYEGLTKYFDINEREKLQKPSSLACSAATELIAKTGMNVILPNAPYSLEKLENKISSLLKHNYDIHLIYFDAPYNDLASRSYYRYLVAEYEQKKDTHGNIIHGRFVPISIIKNFGDPCHDTFVKAYNQKRYKSFKAFFNCNETKQNEEIDLETMEK